MYKETVGGIKYFGDIDPKAIAQMENCLSDPRARYASIMGDGHYGYQIPIGGVVGYSNAVSPSGVGYDIACGNKCVLIDADASDVRKNISKIMDDIFSNISFGVGRINQSSVESPLLDDTDIWKENPMKDLHQLASNQLGTIGSGNHFVDVFSDELDRVWIGIHCGSRGFGHKIATYFLEKANAPQAMDEPPCVLGMDSTLGEDYFRAMKIAGEYAYAGRDWICKEVAKIIGANIIEEVHNHHNFCWEENHFGEDIYVVRKGSTPAFPGQKCFVGGSMGDISVILEGVESEESESILYSTVHGAGRVMGRMEAKGKIKFDKETKERRVVREPKISREDMDTWLRGMNVELRGADVGESPQAYKRLPEVLAHHDGTIKIVHTLTPLGVCMAGSDVRDPYKD